VGKLMRMAVGFWLAKEYFEFWTGKNKMTVGSFIPYFGDTVNSLIGKARGKRLPTRSPFTVVQQFEEGIKGWKDYIDNGDTRRLRKIGLNFGLALFGVGGGSQINNIIDGVLADIEGEVKNVKGKTLFKVDTLKDRVKAPIFGIWSTDGGQEYWNTPSKTQRTYNKLNTLGSKERVKEFNKLDKRTKTLVNYLFLEDKYRMNQKLRDIRGKSVEERANAITKFMKKLNKAERKQIGEQLKDVGILTDAVYKKMTE